MNIAKVALAASLFALGTPLAAQAQSVPANYAAIQSAALGTLSPDSRFQVRNILGFFTSGQLDANTAAAQIDAVLSESEAKSVLEQAKKANITAEDPGQFLVGLARPPGK